MYKYLLDSEFSQDAVPKEAKEYNEAEDEKVEEEDEEEEQATEEEPEKVEAPVEEEKEEEVEEESEKEEQEVRQTGPKKLKDLSDEEKVVLYDKMVPAYTKAKKQIASLIGSRKLDSENTQSVPVEKISIDDNLSKIAEERGIDKSELKNTVALMESLLPQMGYVKKGDVSKQTYKQLMQSQVDEFVASNPIFAPGTVDGDSNWTIFDNHFNQTYKLPKNPNNVVKLLEKAKEDLFGKDENMTVNKAFAKIRKNKTATLGSKGGSSTKGSVAKTNAKQLSSTQKEMLKGFTEEEVKEFYG